MRQVSLLLALIIILLPHAAGAKWEASPHLQVNASDSFVDVPISGQVMQGKVAIHGSTGTSEINSYEVDFSYTNNPTGTWFLIQEGKSSITNAVLAVWDTTMVTDGEYSLRLSVQLADGSMQEAIVNSLRVRNYTPVETGTPSPNTIHATVEQETPSSALTSEPSSSQTYSASLGTPTPLPANPAEITNSQMVYSLGKGVAFTLGSFALFAAYLGWRSKAKKRR